MLVGQNVVDRQHAARRQDTNEVVDIAGIGRALGVEKDELPLAVAGSSRIRCAPTARITTSRSSAVGGSTLRKRSNRSDSP
jgi:hypothetical protein